MAANNTTTVVRPDPDPTVRTTEQLLRELENLKEIFQVKFDAYDVAVALLQARSDKSPTIGEVVAKVDEKFISIQTQFAERDIRTTQTATDSKTAVDAALNAAKEAVAKSEVSFTKQIDQIGDVIRQLAKGLDDKIDDLKNRIVSIEGGTKGKADAWVWISIAAFIGVTVLAFIFKGGA